MREIVKKLYLNQDLSDEEFLTLLKSDEDIEILNLYARKRAEENYGKSVFLRGLIEISNTRLFLLRNKAFKQKNKTLRLERRGHYKILSHGI